MTSKTTPPAHTGLALISTLAVSKRTPLKIEKALGFWFERGMSRPQKADKQYIGDAIPDLLRHIRRLNNDYRAATKQQISNSEELQEEMTRLFNQLAPRLWPDPPLRAHASWLVNATQDNNDGLYPRDLYASSSDDAQALHILFCDLIIAKLLKKSENNARDERERKRKSALLKDTLDQSDGWTAPDIEPKRERMASHESNSRLSTIPYDLRPVPASHPDPDDSDGSDVSTVPFRAHIWNAVNTTDTSASENRSRISSIAGVKRPAADTGVPDRSKKSSRSKADKHADERLVVVLKLTTAKLKALQTPNNIKSPPKHRTQFSPSGIPDQRHADLPTPETDDPRHLLSSVAFGPHPLSPPTRSDPRPLSAPRQAEVQALSPPVQSVEGPLSPPKQPELPPLPPPERSESRSVSHPKRSESGPLLSAKGPEQRPLSPPLCPSTYESLGQYIKASFDDMLYAHRPQSISPPEQPGVLMPSSLPLNSSMRRSPPSTTQQPPPNIRTALQLPGNLHAGEGQRGSDFMSRINCFFDMSAYGKTGNVCFRLAMLPDVSSLFAAIESTIPKSQRHDLVPEAITISLFRPSGKDTHLELPHTPYIDRTSRWSQHTFETFLAALKEQMDSSDGLTSPPNLLLSAEWS